MLVTLAVEKIVSERSVIGFAVAVDHDDCNGCLIA